MIYLFIPKETCMPENEVSHLSIYHTWPVIKKEYVRFLPLWNIENTRLAPYLYKRFIWLLYNKYHIIYITAHRYIFLLQGELFLPLFRLCALKEYTYPDTTRLCWDIVIPRQISIDQPHLVCVFRICYNSYKRSLLVIFNGLRVDQLYRLNSIRGWHCLNLYFCSFCDIPEPGKGFSNTFAAWMTLQVYGNISVSDVSKLSWFWVTYKSKHRDSSVIKYS